MSKSNTYNPNFAIHPGKTIAKLMKINNLNKFELAILMQVKEDFIDKLIKEEVNINYEIASKLGTVFKLKTSFFINLQELYNNVKNVDNYVITYDPETLIYSYIHFSEHNQNLEYLKRYTTNKKIVSKVMFSLEEAKLITSQPDIIISCIFWIHQLKSKEMGIVLNNEDSFSNEIYNNQDIQKALAILSWPQSN